MNWQALFEHLGIAGLVITALVYLGKKISEQYFSKDLEKFKSELRTAAFEREVRIQKLHEKRAEVIAELYKRLAQTHAGVISIVELNSQPGGSGEKERIQLSDQAGQQFKDYFNQNRIYFTQSICESIEEFIKTLEKANIFWANAQPGAPLSETEYAWKLRQEAWETVKDKSYPLRVQIEKLFRGLLEGNQPQS